MSTSLKFELLIIRNKISSPEDLEFTKFDCTSLLAKNICYMFQRKEKKERVNRILESLCAGIVSPSKKRHDLSYLFTGHNKT